MPALSSLRLDPLADPDDLPFLGRSCLNGAMTRWFFGFFFTFPRPLAEGNG
jgi:hypothetical protein